MKTEEKLLLVKEKLEALAESNMYPPSKKMLADELLIELVEAAAANHKSETIIHEFLDIYKEIDYNY